MRPFIFTLVTGCSLLGAIIVWADPGHRWHRRPVFAAHRLSPGEVWVLPHNDLSPVDMRLMKMLHLESIATPTVLLLGSSRGQGIQEYMFLSGDRLFNASVNAASIEDYVAFWQATKNAGKVPARVIILLDPWQFNRNWWSGLWYVNLKYVAEFRPDQFSFVERLDAWTTDLREIFSFDSLKSAFRYLCFQRWHENVGRELILPERQRPLGRAALRWDGTIAPERLNSKEPRLSNRLNIRAEQMVSHNGGNDTFRDWQLDVNATDLAQHLLTDIAARTQLLVIAMPFPKVTLQAFSSHERFVRGMADFSNVLKRLQTSTAATFCDATIASTSGCLEEEFSDPVHPGPSCVEKVLHRCLSLGSPSDSKLYGH